MKKIKKKHILVAALTAMILLVITSRNRGSDGIPVNVGYPQRATVVESIPANGKIRPVTEIKISPDVSGEIIELNVKEGDIVKEGDLLIKIRQDLYISAVERAQASLNSVKAQYSQQKSQLAQSEQAFKRDKTLYGQKAISKAEYENSLSRYEIAVEQLNSAKYNIKSAEAALKEAKENLQKTAIYAPISGIVSKLEVEKGERVVGTSQMAGTEMMRIADFNEMEVLVDVNENDIIKLDIADTAYVEVDAYPNKKFRGIVTEIANSAKNSGVAASLDQVTTFEVHVAICAGSYQDLLEKDSVPFRPGMSASVGIETEICHNALVVPLQAITTRSGLTDSLPPDSITEYIFTYDKATSKVKPAIVRTGIQDMKNIVVLDGLSDSTLIVTGPYSAITRELKSGSVVQIKEEHHN